MWMPEFLGCEVNGVWSSVRGGTFKRWWGHKGSSLMNGLILLLRKWVSYLWSGLLIKAWVWPFQPSHLSFSCSFLLSRLLSREGAARRCCPNAGTLRLDITDPRAMRHQCFLCYPIVLFSYNNAERWRQLSIKALSSQGGCAQHLALHLLKWELWLLLRVSFPRSSNLCHGPICSYLWVTVTAALHSSTRRCSS